jgi:high frequency lysogenization protein
LSRPLSERVLALAGVVQALAQVRRIAETGQSDANAVQTVLDSVFRIDADTPQAVYAARPISRPACVCYAIISTRKPPTTVCPALRWRYCSWKGVSSAKPIRWERSPAG